MNVTGGFLESNGRRVNNSETSLQPLNYSHYFGNSLVLVILT